MLTVCVFFLHATCKLLMLDMVFFFCFCMSVWCVKFLFLILYYVFLIIFQNGRTDEIQGIELHSGSVLFFI